LVVQLQALTTQLEAYDREIRRVLKLHPDGELYRSLSGAGDTLAARMVGELGDNRDRYQDSSIAQCEAGTAPVIQQSASTRTVHFRRACIHPLRETLWVFASAACATVRRRKPTTRRRANAARSTLKPFEC
jgi:transposase